MRDAMPRVCCSQPAKLTVSCWAPSPAALHTTQLKVLSCRLSMSGHEGTMQAVSRCPAKSVSMWQEGCVAGARRVSLLIKLRTVGRWQCHHAVLRTEVMCCFLVLKSVVKEQGRQSL